MEVGHGGLKQSLPGLSGVRYLVVKATMKSSGSLKYKDSKRTQKEKYQRQVAILSIREQLEAVIEDSVVSCPAALASPGSNPPPQPPELLSQRPWGRREQRPVSEQALQVMSLIL